MIIYPAFPAQFAEFCGHSTALDAEIIRELLAVKGDPEGLFLLFFRSETPLHKPTL